MDLVIEFDPEDLGRRVNIETSLYQSMLSDASPEQAEDVAKEIEASLAQYEGCDGISVSLLMMLRRVLGVAYTKVGQAEKGKAIMSEATAKLMQSFMGRTVTIKTPNTRVEIPVSEIVEEETEADGEGSD